MKINAFEPVFGIALFERATGKTGNAIAVWRRRDFLTLPMPAGMRGPGARYSLAQGYEIAVVAACQDAGVSLERASALFRARVRLAAEQHRLSRKSQLPKEFEDRDANLLHWWIFGSNRAGRVRDSHVSQELFGDMVSTMKWFVAVEVTSVFAAVDEVLLGTPSLHAGEQME